MNDDRFLSSRELAKRWGISIDTLRNWRYLDKGPEYTKVGHSVRYRMSDVVEYENNGQAEGDEPTETDV